MHKALMFAVNPVILANVFLQPPGCKFLLFFREPTRRTREVRQDEGGKYGNDDGYGSLDDEKPSPENSVSIRSN
jgi:hypothetical protein